MLESFSVWGVDVSKPTTPKVTSRLKTGLLVGAPSDNGKTVGGSAPNFLVVHGDSLYVSNGNNDVIERIDRTHDAIATRRQIVPSLLVERVRGVSPAGMAVSPDGKRLYVAELGINAIGVLNASTFRICGHIRTTWYPYRVAVSPDGRSLACICFRGFGNGPNAGKAVPPSPYLGMKGALSVLAVPTDADLATMTRTVLENNGIVDRQADLPAMSSLVIRTFSEKPPGRSNTLCSSPRKTTLTTRYLTASPAPITTPTCSAGGCTRRSRPTVSRRSRMSA